MKNIIRILSIVCIILIIGTIASQTVNAQNERERHERMEVNFEADKKYQNPSGRNLADSEDVLTERQIWEQDMGEVPEGVLVGNLLEPSLYELDYEPRWRNEFNHGEDTAIGEYGYTNLVQTVEVSSSKIMNGASEFYVQVPVHSDSVQSITLNTHERDDPRVMEKRVYSSISVFEGDYSDTDVHTRLTQTIDAGRTYFTDNGQEIEPEAVVPIVENDKHGERPYVKMNMFFESDTTYTFVYNILSAGEKPRIFTTASENFGDLGIQYGATQITNILNAYRDAEYNAMYYTLRGFYTDPYRFSYVNDAENIFEEYEDTPLKLATSFVFTKGMGDRNLFGHELNIESGDILHFYPDIDLGNYEPGSDVNTISMYMPFISEKNLGNEVNISIGVAGEDLDERAPHEWTIWNWEDIEWDFNEFILYTDTKNWEHIDYEHEYGTGLTVYIQFHDSVDLTLLMSGRDSKYEMEFGNTHRIRRWNNANMRLTGEDYAKNLLGLEESEESITGWIRTHETCKAYEQRNELFFTMPKMDVSVTQDRWAQVNSTGDGMESYSHAFDVAEYYSNITYDMVDEEGRRIIINVVTEEKPEDHLHSPWYYGEKFLRANLEWQLDQYTRVATWFVGEGGGSGSDGGDTWLVGRITNAVKTIISSFWEGVRDVFGAIRDTMFWVYEKIMEGLNIIYDAIMDFVDWIVGILEDIWEILGVLTERISYIIGMLGFVFMMGGMSKVIKMSDWNMLSGGK